MVGQHRGEQRLVGEQRVLADAEFGEQRSEGIVGGGEDGKRTGPGKRRRQVRRHHGLGQDAEARIGLRRLDDVQGLRRGIVVVAATPGGEQRGRARKQQELDPVGHFSISDSWQRARKKYCLFQLLNC